MSRLAGSNSCSDPWLTDSWQQAVSTWRSSRSADIIVNACDAMPLTTLQNPADWKYKLSYSPLLYHSFNYNVHYKMKFYQLTQKDVKNGKNNHKFVYKKSILFTWFITHKNVFILTVFKNIIFWYHLVLTCITKAFRPEAGNCSNSVPASIQIALSLHLTFRWTVKVMWSSGSWNCLPLWYSKDFLTKNRVQVSLCLI